MLVKGYAEIFILIKKKFCKIHFVGTFQGNKSRVYHQQLSVSSGLCKFFFILVVGATFCVLTKLCFHMGERAVFLA